MDDDLVVNGGGILTVKFSRPGYLPLQRSIDVSWQDYACLQDAVMIQLDPQVSIIDLSTPGGKIARGSIVSDDSGTRQATLYFPDGIKSDLPGTTIHVRATEYSVGQNGRMAMPAELPPTAAFTYCVELSADEAAGRTVTFDQPICLYVENFLNFPSGTRVPVGYYDYAKAAWVPSQDGRVIRVLGIDSGGLAVLDVLGYGRVANSQDLADLGISVAERRKLAELYSPGQSIWRARVRHFSPWDCNWPYGPPAGAKQPGLAKPRSDGTKDDPCDELGGSTIEIQNQILRETIGITGVPYSLNYASDRVPGRKAAYTVEIPLSEAQVPPGLKRIELEIQIAGKTYAEAFAPQPNQVHTFTWDGKDAYGRELQGKHPAVVKIGYTYDAVYYSSQDAPENSFGTVSGMPITSSRARQEVTLWEEYRIMIGSWQAGAFGLGGWTMDVQHFYDPGGRVLYLGDGTRRSATNIPPVISTIAGTGVSGYSGDGGPATAARLANPMGVTVGPDGSIYIGERLNHCIRKIDPNGLIRTVAGTGQEGYSGDGGSASAAKLAYPWGAAVGPDGSVYISDTVNHRIRRVDLSGIITTVAGTGQSGYGGDGGPATAALLSYPEGIAVGPDGSIYITEYYSHRIRRVGPDGNIITIAGIGGVPDYYGDDGPATSASFNTPWGVAVGPDGSVFVADYYNNRIRRVGPDGHHNHRGWNVVARLQRRWRSGAGGATVLTNKRRPWFRRKRLYCRPI